MPTEKLPEKDAFLKAMQDKRDAAEADIGDMLALAASEKRDINEVEIATIDERKAEIATLDQRESELLEMAEKRHAADERRARHAAAIEPTVELVNVRSEPATYSRGAQHSYFADLVKSARGGDPDANERLQRHSREIRATAERRLRDGREEYRDLTRVDGSAGNFVPPIYLVDEFVALARASRVTADLIGPRALPGGTDSINIPAVSTGTATAIQTADNAAVQETDMTDANLAAPVRTISGQQDVAVQLLEQSPVAFDDVIFSDLVADYNTKLDLQVLSGSGAAGQLTGIRTVAGSNAVSYADVTPTVPEIYPKIADAIQQIATGIFMPADAIVMHPRRWAWFTAALDSQNRPLVVPTALNPMNAMSTIGEVKAEGAVGQLQGLPVYVDPSIPTNVGAGTEDVILVLRTSDLYLWESSIRTRVLPDIGSGTLTTRLQVYGFMAAQFARRPKAISIVSGTGLIAPTF